MKLGRFDLDMSQRCLMHAGEIVRLGARAFDILAALVSAEGRVVSRAELMDAAWPDVVVEDCNIDVHVSALRKALGADREMIVTVSRRGYRCALPVPTSEERNTAQVRLPARRDLCGREAAIDEIVGLLADRPLITLTGIGGIGKTSLAIEVAHVVAAQGALDPVFVDLSLAHDGETVRDAVTRSCAAEVATLAHTPRLIVLDNAEHVICAVADLVDTLLVHGGPLRLLVTSREPLRVRAEQRLAVPPIGTPEPHASDADILRAPAVQLFMRHADLPCSQAGVQLQAIGEICRRLDGIALAIELAAERVTVLGVEGVRRRLDDRLTLLTGGYRNATPRHRALRATFDASFALLSATAQRLLERLAPFTQTFTFESMRAAVCDAELTEAHVTDGIGELVSKSLVNVSLEGPQASYRLFESIRLYAAHKHNEARSPMALLAA